MNVNPFKVRIEITETDFGLSLPTTDTTLPLTSTTQRPILTFPTAAPLQPSSADQRLSPTPIGPPMSTDEPLRPIPPATTASGDPDGHHEISEPNLTATAPCRGCSPVIEISVSGWDTSPAADHAGSVVLTNSPARPSLPPQATITAGESNVVVSPAPGGGGIVIGGSTTVLPGQTITVSNTPIAIQTSEGQTQVVVGTKTVTVQPNQPYQPSSPQSYDSQITAAPILAPLIIGGETITANPALEYIIGTKTLAPAGPAITVSGTTLSLLPSATAVVINGQTTQIVQGYGGNRPTTIAPLLTWKSRIFTPNVAGYYRLGPGTTLMPGGPPVTVSGTVVSLDYGGTAVVFAGSTSFMTPTTTTVTWMLPTGPGGAGNAGGSLAQSTGKHSGGNSGRGAIAFGTNGVIEGFFLLGVLSVGWLAIWL